MKHITIIFLCLSSVLSFRFPKIDSRIINGERAAKGQFPFEVGLYVEMSDGTYLCGGSIISEEWILTAGHCVHNALSAKILAGIIELDDSEVVTLESDNFIVHEDYNRTNLQNDIALIKLNETLTLNDNIKVIPLAEEPLGENVKVTVSGWGVTSDSSTTVNNFLSYITLVTISNSVCQESFETNIIFNGMVCATSDPSENKSPCTGDSGSPLVTVDEDNKALLVGVVSFVGPRGCEKNDPSGYTRVAAYRDWIREKTGI